jgi:ubiquinone/menaquinone biosynthesis C-methylase UbiE
MRLSPSTSFFDPYAVNKAAGVRSGHTVVDLHCGYHGGCALAAAEHVGTDGQVYGVDIRRNALDSIQGRARTLGHAHFQAVRGDAQSQSGVPLDDEIADVALIVNGLSELDEKLEVVKEAVRLLKSGGRLAIVDWHPSGQAHFGPHSSRRVSESEARSTCLVTGLKYMGSFDVGSHHYGFICSKS